MNPDAGELPLMDPFEDNPERIDPASELQEGRVILCTLQRVRRHQAAPALNFYVALCIAEGWVAQVGGHFILTPAGVRELVALKGEIL